MKRKVLIAGHNRTKKPFLTKRKKIVFIVSGTFVLILSFFLMYYYKSARKLKVFFDSFKFDSYKLVDIPSIYLNGLNATCNILVQNFSNLSFNVTQISVDVYTLDDVSLASQKNPMSEPISVKANSNTIIPIKYNISRSGVMALMKDTNFFTILKNYIGKGIFDKKVKIKGFVVANNINVPIEETIDI